MTSADGTHGRRMCDSNQFSAAIGIEAFVALRDVHRRASAMRRCRCGSLPDAAAHVEYECFEPQARIGRGALERRRRAPAARACRAAGPRRVVRLAFCSALIEHVRVQAAERLPLGLGELRQQAIAKDRVRTCAASTYRPASRSGSRAPAAAGAARARSPPAGAADARPARTARAAASIAGRRLALRQRLGEVEDPRFGEVAHGWRARRPRSIVAASPA